MEDEVEDFLVNVVTLQVLILQFFWILSTLHCFIFGVRLTNVGGGGDRCNEADEHVINPIRSVRYNSINVKVFELTIVNVCYSDYKKT